MRIQNILESLYKDDFEIVTGTLYTQDEKVVHCGVTIQDERSHVEYMVDLFIEKATKKYQIEQIVVVDGDDNYDGDRDDAELVKYYLSNNVGYVLDYVLENG